MDASGLTARNIARRPCQRTREQSPGTSTSKGIELGARKTWATSAFSTPPRTTKRMALRYRLSRDSIDIGNVALDDYEVADLSLAYAFNAVCELYGRIENATDEDYQDVIGYNTAGRVAYAGIRLRF
jgi:vitamin B12 transporter